MHTISAFSGGGGKSSLIYRTAEELASEGFRVLVTTTTMIFHPEVKNRPFSSIAVGNLESLFKVPPLPGKGSITVAASAVVDSGEGRKLKGFSGEDIDRLADEGIFDAVLAEGDGAKHLPIKAPGEGEPVIPAKTGRVFGVIGMDAWNAEISADTVFRLENFLSVTGAEKGSRIGKDEILKLVSSKEGLFKNTPPGSDRVLVLNKADSPELVKTAAYIGEYIIEKNRAVSMVTVTSAVSKDPVIMVIRRKA